MTDPKPWPYWAADARDRAAESAAEALRLIEPLATAETDLERIRRISRAVICLYLILRLLEAAGANTRP